VLTGGRLTLEDAYGYSKFARAVLGTNNIDFRARQHSSEEADFLAHAVAGTGLGVSFADLENASSVLLVCLEPEEEAGMIFLRLRKAFRKKHLTTWTLAPYPSSGSTEDGTPSSSAAFLVTKPTCLISFTRRPARRMIGWLASLWTRIQ
jgi:NADH-quinone oxidoreductase subunit G